MHTVSMFSGVFIGTIVLVPMEAKVVLSLLAILAVGYIIAEHIVQHKAF